jgi:anti-sigma B factor antagonist
VKDGGDVVLVMSGEFDLAAAYLVDDRLSEVRSDARNVVLDMRSVTFMDSTGLRSLLRANNLAERSGFAITIVGCSGQVADVIRIAGLEHHLPLSDSQ